MLLTTASNFALAVGSVAVAANAATSSASFVKLLVTAAEAAFAFDVLPASVSCL